jgi:hypothetical protein
MNLFYQGTYFDNFLQRWFWRAAYAIWTRLMNRFGRQSLRAAGFVLESIAEAELRKDDEKLILSALLFLAEVAQESDEMRIRNRAVRHAAGIAAAREHRTGLNWVRELPEKLPYITEGYFPTNATLTVHAMDADSILDHAADMGAAIEKAIQGRVVTFPAFGK